MCAQRCEGPCPAVPDGARLAERQHQLRTGRRDCECAGPRPRRARAQGGWRSSVGASILGRWRAAPEGERRGSKREGRAPAVQTAKASFPCFIVLWWGRIGVRGRRGAPLEGWSGGWSGSTGRAGASRRRPPSPASVARGRHMPWVSVFPAAGAPPSSGPELEVSWVAPFVWRGLCARERLRECRLQVRAAFAQSDFIGQVPGLRSKGGMIPGVPCGGQVCRRGKARAQGAVVPAVDHPDPDSR